MSSSTISAIEDLIDDLEDSAYNHESSFKINSHRNKISFALNNLLKEREETKARIVDSVENREE